MPPKSEIGQVHRDAAASGFDINAYWKELDQDAQETIIMAYIGYWDAHNAVLGAGKEDFEEKNQAFELQQKLVSSLIKSNAPEGMDNSEFAEGLYTILPDIVRTYEAKIGADSTESELEGLRRAGRVSGADKAGITASITGQGTKKDTVGGMESSKFQGIAEKLKGLLAGPPPPPSATEEQVGRTRTGTMARLGIKKTKKSQTFADIDGYVDATSQAFQDAWEQSKSMKITYKNTAGKDVVSTVGKLVKKPEIYKTFDEKSSTGIKIEGNNESVKSSGRMSFKKKKPQTLYAFEQENKAGIAQALSAITFNAKSSLHKSSISADMDNQLFSTLLNGKLKDLLTGSDGVSVAHVKTAFQGCFQQEVKAVVANGHSNGGSLHPSGHAASK